MIPILNEEDLLKRLESRNTSFDNLEETVKKILEDVKSIGDKAVYDFTAEFDDYTMTSYDFQKPLCPEEPLKKSLDKAFNNIKAFHELQTMKSQFQKTDGKIVGELIRPLKRIGIYVPGGKASYPSTVLMNAIPAMLAGVEEIVMVTPPSEKGLKESIYYAAQLCGVKEIYTIGGAQSIAALAYGTESIKPVSKIVGPGNAFVSMAKKLVSNRVAIDMIAGPSEVLVIADGSSNPQYIAADLIAQAEHDEKASAILISTCESLVEKVATELFIQVKDHPRSEIIKTSLMNYSGMVVVHSLDQAIELSNRIAPEHLELMFDSAEEFLDRISNAGAVFVGHYTPEALGDYIAGPNHTLPTNGTAKFASPLGVRDFIKTMSYIKYESSKLKEEGKMAVRIACDEGLFGHANSIDVRLKSL
jgi:histidinol dehydrogenase